VKGDQHPLVGGIEFGRGKSGLHVAVAGMVTQVPEAGRVMVES